MPQQHRSGLEVERRSRVLAEVGDFRDARGTARHALVLGVLGLLAGLASNGAGAASLPANLSPATVVPQTGAAAAGVAAIASRVRMPQGFKIAPFAVIPGARTVAVAPSGTRVFVGTMGREAYVLTLATPHGPVIAAKTFAPSIAKRMAHGVCFAPDGTLFLAEQNRILAFPQAARDAESPTLSAQVVVAQDTLIPPERESLYHSMRVCRVGPDGRLYVTIGQPHNVSPPADNAAYAKLGMGAIIRMKADGSQREIFALGIRNSVGLDFSPRDGTLWFTDNQSDHMGDDFPPGEINRATKPGQNFGFPWYGGGHTRTREWADATPPSDLVFPEVETVAHAADLGMTFYRGTAFPERYRGGIFSAQHGSWDRTVSVGARVMFTPVGPDGHAAAPAAPFAEGWRNADGTYAGRPVDVAELPDGSLLVTDDLVGAIYRISYEESRPVSAAP